MLKAVLRTFLKGEKGFTLIELLAVMGIVAVLAAIVSTSVTGTGEKSKDTTAQQDAGTTQTSAGAYFADQGAPVLSAEADLLTTKVNSAGPEIIAVAQAISSAWPEAFITANDDATHDDGTTASIYYVEFGDESIVLVEDVILTLADGTTKLTETVLLGDYTAVDFDLMINSGYADKEPASASIMRVIDMATDVTVHQYLWLFEKTTSSAGDTDDSRSVVVFKLDTVTIATDKATLNYEQIF